MTFYIAPVSLRPYLSSANEGLDYSVMLPDSLMMSQQTGSFGFAAKLKMVSIWIFQICRDTRILNTGALQLVEDEPFWRQM